MTERSLLSSLLARAPWLALVVWPVCAALYLTLPPSPDQFNHAYLGWRLLEGDVPYRDVIDMNWPGVMGGHAFAIWLFGVNLWSWRAFDFLVFGASALLLADIVRQAAGRDAAWLLLLIAPVMYVGDGYWVAGQHDMSAGQFLVVALWFHVRAYGSNAWRWQIGTGTFIALAMLHKPTVAVIAPLLMLQVIWLRKPLGQIVVHSAIAGGALFATLAAGLGAVLARGTAISDAVDALYTYNAVTRFVDPLPLGTLAAKPAGSLLWLGATLISVCAMPWQLGRAARSVATSVLPVLWLTGVVSYFAQGRGFMYHLAPSFLALAGGVAIALSQAASGALRLGRVRVGRGGAAVLLVAVALGFGYRLFDSYRALPGAVLWSEYARHLSRFSAGDGVTVADAASFAERAHQLPTRDCLFYVGRASAISYLAQRKVPTRFYYFPVIENAVPPLPMAPAWVDQWERDLRASACSIILIGPKTAQALRANPGAATAALHHLLSTYEAAGHIGGATGATAIFTRPLAGS